MADLPNLLENIEEQEYDNNYPSAAPDQQQISSSSSTTIIDNERKDSIDDTELSRFNQNPPDDKFNYNYLIFYLLGMTTLLPWNFFVTAEDYWLFKFRNVSFPNSSDLTPIQKSFTSDLSVSASIPGTLCLIINTIIGHLIPLNIKMIGSMIGILVLFIVTTIFVEINTDTWQTEFFVITIVIIVLLNSFSALLSGGLFGITGLFPSEYMTAVVSGQALGGIFTALALILTLTFGMDPKVTALAYFNIGNLVILIAIISYIVMSRTQFFRFYAIDSEVIEKKKNDNVTISTASTETLTSNEGHNAQMPDFMTILKKIYLYALAEFGVFAITLCVYPAVTVLVQSQNHGSGHPWSDIYFEPVVNYLTFNSGDYLGRILAGAFERPKNKPNVIVILMLLRILFVPFLMMGNMYSHNYMPTIIHSDIAFVCLIACFAITNGYIANISLIMAPKVVMHHEKELASSIMAACLSLGLTIGSAISFIMVQIA